MSSSFWQLGFRPFFLLGSLQALVVMLLWIGFLAGWLPQPGQMDPVLWHSHEMIFGFTTAIIAGFLLTAVQNWTGIPGVRGRPLQSIVLLWVLGRVLMAIPGVPVLLTALVDLSFFPYLAYLLAPYFKDPELKMERVFFLFFTLLFIGNLLAHLQALGILAGYGRSGVLLGLDTVILVIVLIGGRVIPFFTESSIARRQPRTYRWVEVASHASVALYLLVDFLFPASLGFAIVAFLTAITHFIRLLGWQVRRVRRVSLIWVLHAAYLWLVLGFLLSGLSSLGLFAQSLALHAFTVGGIGVIIYGMISRVSLGHTGRRLHPSAWMVVGYALLNFSALVRVFGPMVFSSQYTWVLIVSGVLWCMAFTLFLFVYTPMLMAPRIDGQPG